MKKKIALAGGSGFIGKGIVKYFGETGYDFLALTHQTKNRTDGVKEVYWDTKTLGLINRHWFIGRLSLYLNHKEMLVFGLQQYPENAVIRYCVCHCRWQMQLASNH